MYSCWWLLIDFDMWVVCICMLVDSVVGICVLWVYVLDEVCGYYVV